VEKSNNFNSGYLLGIPGAGKTILCSTIIEHMTALCSQSSDYSAYFYFDDRQTVVGMLKFIVVQLCSTQSKVPSELHQLYTQCDHGRDLPDPTALMRVLLSLLTPDHRTFVP